MTYHDLSCRWIMMVDEFSPQANQVTDAGGLEAKFGVVKNVDSDKLSLAP